MQTLIFQYRLHNKHATQKKPSEYLMNNWRSLNTRHEISVSKYPPWDTLETPFEKLISINSLSEVNVSFYQNVTTLRSGLCYRQSVCLSSVTLLHPTQAVESFGNISLPRCTFAILWPQYKILRRSSQGNPSIGCVKRKKGSKIQRFWTCPRIYLINYTR